MNLATSRLRREYRALSQTARNWQGHKPPAQKNELYRRLAELRREAQQLTQGEETCRSGLSF